MKCKWIASGGEDVVMSYSAIESDASDSELVYLLDQPVGKCV
jgi:hypothetical protein